MDIEFSIDTLGNRQQQFRTFPTDAQNAFLDAGNTREAPQELRVLAIDRPAPA